MSCGVKNKTFSKIGYVFFDLFWVLIAILLLYTADDFESILPSAMYCDELTYPDS
jgi:hypothetical protein